MKVALTQPVSPGSKTPGTSAADAVTEKASAMVTTAVIRSFLMHVPPWLCCVSVVPAAVSTCTRLAPAFTACLRRTLVRGTARDAAVSRVASVHLHQGVLILVLAIHRASITGGTGARPARDRWTVIDLMLRDLEASHVVLRDDFAAACVG